MLVHAVCFPVSFCFDLVAKFENQEMWAFLVFVICLFNLRGQPLKFLQSMTFLKGTEDFQIC